MSHATTALVIDDEADIRELMSLTINRMGFDCHVAANLEEARNLIDQYEFDVCLTDMKLPDGNGVDFVKFLQSVKPDLPVAVLTAHGNMEAAVEAMKNGAYDFVSKPVDIHLLRKLVIGAVASNQRSANDNPISDSIETRTGVETVTTPSGTEALVGNSPIMKELRDMILKVAKSNAPVWITGESGTGKEMIARLIHTNGPRADKPFIPINCGAIPSELMESELFGHKKGSFTGAVTDNPGLFRQAEGGTLFLDEVAELPLQMQVKLLRAIQEKAVRSVGENHETSIDVRILSASHKDLAGEVNQGSFRHDLYYRLNVINLRSPALAERRSDIRLLANHLLSSICESNQRSPVTLSEQSMQQLELHPFHGNVRELENILERALAMSENDVLDTHDLNLSQSGNTGQTTIQAKAPDAVTQTEVDRFSPDYEKQLILDALTKTRWNRKAAATLLGLSYRQIRYRIQQYEIDDPKTD